MAEPRTRYLLLATDLDGTLLCDSDRVSLRAKRALCAAHEAGCLVVIATGRAYCEVPAAIRQSNCVDAFITSNGARVLLAGGNTVQLLPMDKDAAVAIVDNLTDKKNGINLFFNGDSRYDLSYLKMAVHAAEAPLVDRLRTVTELLSRTVSTAKIRQIVRQTPYPIEKISVLCGEYAEAQHLLAYYSAQPGLTTVTTTGSDIEITVSGVSKGSALRMLCELYRIPTERVLVCGDSGNDFTLRESSGCFVAPDTAAAEILAVADVVTKSARHGGVSDWLISEFCNQQ